MAYNPVTKEPTLIVITSTSCNSPPSDLHPFTALKQNLRGHRFKDSREVDTIVTRWLITQNTGLYRQGIEKLAARYDVM
jgi:hypothetical protein